MTIQTIYKKAVNNGYNAKTVEYNSGKYAVIIDGFKTIDFINSIMQIYKRSNVHIDFNVYTMTAHIMDNSDYEAHLAYNEAKTIQREYAENHNCIDVFNTIYA